MDAGRAQHWQDAWDSAGLAVGRRVPGREKFFALVAYPGTSGFLHVGHLRGLCAADAIHRYHRMRGHVVLFPFGVHASGLPAVAFAQKVKDRDPLTIGQLEEREVPASERERLEDPEYAARYLGETYRRVLRSMGILVDPTTYLTTIDEDYRAFIRWQFRVLRETGSIVQGSYFASICPVCGPVAVDPSETDLSRGGTAEVLHFATVPFPLDDGRILLAATLRPETVFGVTNLWVPPHGSFVVWHRGSDAYLVARAGAEHLVEQHGGHLGHEVPVAELVGHQVRVPLRDALVPVLANRLVDPKVGTGVVMSVPAHAPVDMQAWLELDAETRSTLGSPPILLEIAADSPLSTAERDLVAGPGTPAERALRSTGAKSGLDTVALDAATERLYRLEYVRGRMTVPQLAGVEVRRARERVTEMLLAAGRSFELQEFSEPVVCRNGHEVVIRRVPDQWFLHYADAAWKEATFAATKDLRCWPEDLARELPGILEWFGDRPCARKGRWLGTPFPLDPSWIIEPIADSTFYMAYYVVRRFVTAGRIRLAHLTDAFFDYVFRGIGPGEPTLDRSVLEEARAEFLYWYPLDINIGGKEHKRVHYPASLYTHARLVSRELQPRGLFVHGWITGPAGRKISKKEISKKAGGIPPIEQALEEWGADALRLFQILVASPGQDVEWDPEIVVDSRKRLDEVERLVRQAAGDSEGPPELDAWLFDAVHRLVRDVRTAWEALDLRRAAELSYIGLPAVLRRYYLRGGAPGRATDRVRSAWIRLISPLTPHLAEELGAADSGGLVADRPFPDPEEFPRSEVAEVREAYVDRVEDDLRSVLRPLADSAAEAPQEVVFFVAEPWKVHVEEWMREALARGETPSIKEIVERGSAYPEVAAHRSELAKYVQRVGPQLRVEDRAAPRLDELAILRSVEGYLARRFSFRSVSVYREAEGASADPLGRRDRARPGAPAFYLVRPGAGQPPG